MKYAVVDSVECVCGRKVDVVLTTTGMEYISYHLSPVKKGFCDMSMILTVKERNQ